LKKVLLIILILQSIVYGGDYELKLYEKVLPSLFSKKDVIVYTDKNSYKIFIHSNIFKITQDCSRANVIVAKFQPETLEICDHIPFFATSYRGYHNSKNSIGAFYWRKGRPQLKLHINHIKEYNLSISSSLQGYAE
jgi:hypothetical protein